jgi:hypothetical protein
MRQQSLLSDSLCRVFQSVGLSPILKHGYCSYLCSLPTTQLSFVEIWATCEERERDTNSIGGIVLADQRRSDAGEEYDFEALEDLSPTLARLLRLKFQRV